MGLCLVDDVGEVDDLELLVLLLCGLEKCSVYVVVVCVMFSGDIELLYSWLCVCGLLLFGLLGQCQFEVEQLKICLYVSVLLDWMQGELFESCCYEVEIDGVCLYGCVVDWYFEGLVWLCVGMFNGNVVICQGLDWLLVNVVGDVLFFVQFYDGGDVGFGLYVLLVLSVFVVCVVLCVLLQLCQCGLCELLCFVLYIGWVLYNVLVEKQCSEGWKQWYGSDCSWGEFSSDVWQLLLCGVDLFVIDVGYVDLLCNSQLVFSVVCEGCVFGIEVCQEGNV